MSRLLNRKRLLIFGSLCIYGVLQHHLIRQLHSDIVDNNNNNNNNNNNSNHLPVVATPPLAVNRPRNESDAEGNKHGNHRSSLEKTSLNTTHRYGHLETTHADPMQQLTRQEANQLKRAASIDYFSCCGAGHRLSKLADAYYAAKQLYFTVRVFFGFCSNQEVFSYLFGPKPLNEVEVLDKISAGIRTGKDMKIVHDMYIKVGNEVPGFRKMTRYGRSGDAAANTNTTSCPCLLDNGHRRLDSDVELFTDLRDKRFLGRDMVESFRRNHFSNHTVIGLHIRAGNGEEGDFVAKNRTIRDTDRWCQSMSDILVSLSESFRRENNNINSKPPLLFIASDTATIISRLRTLLRGTMEVVDLQQDRIDHGKGVMFGLMGDVDNNGDQCKQGWVDTFTDMMLLSHADVLVAGRPSSFTQSLPMTLVLSKPKSDRKVLSSFCEVNPEATDVVCYQDLEDWCCSGNTSFSLHTIQRYDYRRMPQAGGLNLEEYRNQLKMRPRIVVDCIPTSNSSTRECLPYEMPDEKSQLMMLRKRRSHIKPRRRIND